MKKKFTILLILIFSFFIVTYVVKSAENIISTSSIDQLVNNVFGNFLEKVKNFIEFADENFLGTILFIILLITIFNSVVNFWRNIKYKNNKGWFLSWFLRKLPLKIFNKKYIIRRCEEESVFGAEANNYKIIEGGDNIYLVECDGKSYHHVVDKYTYLKLGYHRPTKYKKDCFSNAGKKIGKEIKINNTFLSILTILKFKNDLK